MKYVKMLLPIHQCERKLLAAAQRSSVPLRMSRQCGGAALGSATVHLCPPMQTRQSSPCQRKHGRGKTASNPSYSRIHIRRASYKYTNWNYKFWKLPNVFVLLGRLHKCGELSQAFRVQGHRLSFSRSLHNCDDLVQAASRYCPVLIFPLASAKNILKHVVGLCAL